MRVCRYCRKLNNEAAIYCDNCGNLLTAGGAAGNTIALVQMNVGSAELDRLVIGGTASLGQTNAAQQFNSGVLLRVDDGASDPLAGPTGRTPSSAPEWDQ